MDLCNLSVIKSLMDEAGITFRKDFGQNFKSIVSDPRKKAIYGAKLAVAFNLGKENAGKTAFVFHRNLTNNQVELMTTCVIAENGTIAMPGIDYTDLIILY